MNRKRVYDLPTRMFHWIFAVCFLTAFTIANTVDDDGSGFSYHMLAGMVMVFAVAWRIIWGVIGSPHARFTDFSLRPGELVKYLKSSLTGTSRLWSGHNPASSWAAVGMLLLALGLGITGYLMISSPVGESLEDVHEVLANTFIVIVLLHIAGIILHTVKHNDPIGMSMLDGCKRHVPDSTAAVTAHTTIGWVMLALTVGVGLYLLDSYNPDNRMLSIAGVTLQLTEFEDDAHEYGHGDDHDEDDD